MTAFVLFTCTPTAYAREEANLNNETGMEEETISQEDVEADTSVDKGTLDLHLFFDRPLADRSVIIQMVNLDTEKLYALPIETYSMLEDFYFKLPVGKYRLNNIYYADTELAIDTQTYRINSISEEFEITKGGTAAYTANVSYWPITYKVEEVPLRTYDGGFDGYVYIGVSCISESYYESQYDKYRCLFYFSLYNTNSDKKRMMTGQYEMQKINVYDKDHEPLNVYYPENFQIKQNTSSYGESQDITLYTFRDGEELSDTLINTITEEGYVLKTSDEMDEYSPVADYVYEIPLEEFNELTENNLDYVNDPWNWFVDINYLDEYLTESTQDSSGGEVGEEDSPEAATIYDVKEIENIPDAQEESRNIPYIAITCIVAGGIVCVVVFIRKRRK